MNLKGLLALFSLVFFFFIYSCTKINEATTLGDDLIPAVDNVNTFDTTLAVSAAYYPFNDTSRHFLDENMALGKLNDPVFGTTTADIYSNFSSTIYGATPFKDTITAIDSVVLSIAFAGAYGDTSVGSQVSVQVAEIAANNGFVDDSLYKYDVPGFTTTGAALGTKTFSVPQFKDSIRVGLKRDTAKVANVLRIRLNNSLGDKLKAFDTSANGGFNNDSTFRKLFRGLAIKTNFASGAGFVSYFNLTSSNTGIAVYYRNTKNGVKDTAIALFVHNRYGQANSVRRVPGGNYLASLGSPSTDKLYIQSSPSGSYVGMKIPGLETFPNKVIHRAELIAYKVPSTFDNYFIQPDLLLLDHKGNSDSAFLFQNDLLPTPDGGSLNFTAFGGRIKTDNSYRFNITRHVQGIVTRKDRNDSIRIYSPLRTDLYINNSKQTISIMDVIARGRVVLASPNYFDPNMRLRLRIIYSNL